MSFQSFCGKDPTDAATYQKLLGEFMEGGAAGAMTLGAVLEQGNSAFSPTTGLPQDATDFDLLGCKEIATGKVYQGNNLALEIGEALDTLKLKGAITKGSINVGNGAITESLPVGANGLVLKANSATGTGLEWAVDGGGGITGVSGGTNISVDNTNPLIPIVNFATPTTSDIQLGVGRQIIAKDNYATPIYTMSIDNTGFNDTYLNGAVENKEDIAVSATDVIQTISATDGSTYTNTAVIQSGTAGSQAFLSSFNPTALSSQFLRLEATMGGDFNIEHQSNTASRNLAITSNQNLTLGADNIDLSSTGRLIIPSLASADRLDYNPSVGLVVKSDNVGYLTDDLLLLENTNATAGDTTGVPSLEMYKSGRNGAIGDIISTIQFSAKDISGIKRSFARIESTITTNTAPLNIDGSLDFYSLINGVNNLVFRLNGADNENNSFRPLDLNGNSLKTSTGDLLIDATSSTGTGNITLSPKVIGGKVISNGSVQLPSTSTNIQVGTSVGAGVYTTISNAGVNIIDTLGVGVNRQSVFANYGCELYDNGTNNCNSKLDGYALTQTDNQYNKTLTINNFDSGNPNQNSINFSITTTGGQIATTNLVNNTGNQNLQFNLSSGGNSSGLNLSNDSASGGVLNYSNTISPSQPFTIDSSTGDLILKTTATKSLTLNSDILNLENTNTTTSTPVHTSALATTSNIGDITNYLKLQLNGVDIWVPYFTTDPSI